MPEKNLQPWKTIARRTILDYSKFLKIESHTVERADGSVIEDWPWVILPDAAIVLAKTENGKYLCFQQTKYGAGEVTLAPVGGMLEEGEAPLQAARRELLEEAGYVSDEWVPLADNAVDPNRGGGRVHLFLAENAKKVAEPDSDDLEDQRLLEFTREELLTALLEGAFKVVSWSACIALALLISRDRRRPRTQG